MNTAKKATEGPRISELSSGVRVVSEEVPGLSGITCGVWLGMGSTDERPGTGGHSSEYGGMHFLEHVLFKGTKRFDAFEIASRTDAAGAEINAFTAKEHTCFHMQVPTGNEWEALEVLGSVVVEGSCTDEAVDVERGVIADEIAGRDDDPEDLAGEIGYELALPGHPLGRSILGDTRDLSTLTPSALRSLHARAMDPENIVIAAVSPVDHDELCAHLEDSPFAGLTPRRAEERYAERAFDSPRLQPGRGELVALRIDGQQTHVGLTLLTPARDDARRPAVHVAAAVLGAGVSSRMFQGIREKNGVGYNVFAGVDQFGPAGVLQLGASAPANRARHLMTAVSEELGAFDVMPPDEAELRRATGYLRGAILLGYDDPMVRMGRLGRHLLERGNLTTVAESIERLRQVSASDVAEAWELITAQGWHTVVAGPGRERGLRKVASPLARHINDGGRAR